MQKKKIIVLGSGYVGSEIAADLSDKYSVTLADIDPEKVLKVKEKHRDIDFLGLDVTDTSKLRASVSDFDLAVCAVPGFLGFETIRNIIEQGKNVVDISFSPENTLHLDSLAKKNNVTVFIDCGIAPGMDNLFLGYHNERMKVTHFECFVGGLPKKREWPFYYKAPFSPVDVLEEYTRPARCVEGGEVVTLEPLEDSEMIEFEETGELEAFITDGLRSLLYTMPHIEYMKEKTLRYPGHADLIRILRKVGFLDHSPLDFDGCDISPLRFTGKLLIDEWKFNENDEDIMVMRVIIRGKDKSGSGSEVVYNLFDEYSDDTGTSAMARTTGYTANAVTNMFLEGYFSQKGVFPPESLGRRDEVFNYILDYHRARGVIFNRSEKSD